MYSCWSWSDHWVMYRVLQLKVYCNIRFELNIFYLSLCCSCDMGPGIILAKNALFISTMQTFCLLWKLLFSGMWYPVVFIPEDSNLYGHSHENLQFHIVPYNSFLLCGPFPDHKRRCWRIPWGNFEHTITVTGRGSMRAVNPPFPFWGAKIAKIYILSSWK